MSKTIELAKKLKELSQRGEGGEKENATKMLDALMKKHNITSKDIEAEEKEEYFFKIKKKDYPLFLQITLKVAGREIKIYGSFPEKLIREHNLSGNYMLILTPADYILIEGMTKLYRNLYKEELEVFFTAFLQANNLLITPNKEEESVELTEEELKKLYRQNEISQSISKKTFHKQLKQSRE